jgi:hypothetical protein
MNCTDSIAWGELAFVLGFRSIARRHQGVSLGLFEPGHSEAQLLRFDCYDDIPHYHYDPDGRNERHWRDPASRVSALEWAIEIIGSSLPEMAARAGAVAAVGAPSAAFMKKLSDAAVLTDTMHRQVLIHDPGDFLINAPPIVFGICYDAAEGGVSLRVLRDSDCGLEELLGFDCHLTAPHCHYGPRRKNAVIPLDTAVVRDPLGWALECLRQESLPRLLEYCGYPDAAREAGRAEIAQILSAEVEPLARRLEAEGRASTR